MGRKRRLLSAKGKFGNKFNTHPIYSSTKTTENTTDTQTIEDIKVIAKKIDTIEEEVKATQEAANKVITEATETIPKPKIQAKTKPPTTKKTTSTTTKRKRTRKTTKK